MSLTTLKGIDNFADKTMSEIISDNLIEYIDWGLIDKGAFYNVRIPTSGVYSSDRSILRPTNDARFSGKVWEAHNKNWIWQSGVNAIEISGIFINNTFYPKNTVGAYSYYIDYPNGRIVFNTAISTSSTVKLEYSYKIVEITELENVPFFIHIQKQSYRNDISNSGERNLTPETRMQLPSIGVETPPIYDTKPYELGTGGRYSYTQVKFHVFGDNPSMCRRLSDILVDQKETTIFLFDSNKVADSGAFPLNYRGELSSRPLTYPQLVNPENYGYKRATIFETEGSNNITQLGPNVFHTVVKCTVETVLTKL